MLANTFGAIFCLTSFGESHGPALGGVVTGCPPGLPLSDADFAQDMARRRPGGSRHVSQRREADKVELLSGIFEGVTTGTPIGFVIRNTDSRSQDYDDLVDIFRPGHGDYAYWQKYGIRDHRGGGRASARETVVRVATGVIARKWLSLKFGITIRGYLSQLGPIPLPFKNWQAVDANPFFCADEARVSQLEEYVDDLRKSGDSVGGRVDVLATHVPVGWGEPVFRRLDADIASAMMGINAAKAVEIGDGVLSAAQKGSEHSDEMSPEGFLSNHAGGILAGISTGQDIRVRVTFKPTSSIRLPRRSINKKGEAVMVETMGRHDPCVALRATPIVEAMMALILMDHALMQRTRAPDVVCSTPKIPARIVKS